jgi:hypothetical protein
LFSALLPPWWNGCFWAHRSLPFDEFSAIDSRVGESACERIPRGLARCKRSETTRLFLLRIEDSPQLAAESFNCS